MTTEQPPSRRPHDGSEGGDRRGRDRAVLAWLVVVLLAVALPLGFFVTAGDGETEDDALVPDQLEDTAGQLVPQRWTLGAYQGFGAWIDVFDWAPSYQPRGEPPALQPHDLELLAASGVDTIYLQAAGREFRGVVDPALAEEYLIEAHELGLEVVAWYLPRFEDVDAEVDRLEALYDFRAGDHRFDGIAVDIEWTESVPDDDERSERLVELSRRLDDVVDGAPLGAIVLPPLLLEEVNTDAWPDFPWDRLDDVYDVWLPMSYWTFRTDQSGLADPATYIEANNERLRELLGDDALIHPIGGVGDAATEEELRDFAEAIADDRVFGASVYDYRSMTLGKWAVLVDELPGALRGGDDGS